MNLDSRSLAFARICLGVLVFLYSLTFIADWREFYGPQGIAACRITTLSPGENAFLSDATNLAVFVVLPLGGIALALGFFTPASSAACLAATIVLHARAPYVLSHADDVLRLLLLWFIFLPTGQRWSLDARRRTNLNFPLTRRIAAWAYTFQVCLVYWMAAFFKLNDSWLRDGDALARSLHLEHFATPLAPFLLQHPDLLRQLSFITPWFEFLAPLLLFSPYRTSLCRMIAVCAFLFFHLIAIQGMLDIGIFAWVCAIMWLPFIPADIWDHLARRHSVFTRDPEPLPQSPLPRNRWDRWTAAVAIVLFFDLLTWNFAAIHKSNLRLERIEPAGAALGLEQSWAMFYLPYATHGWLVLSATLADGTTVDFYTGQPITDRKPPSLNLYFGDALEKRLLTNLFNQQAPDLLAAYAKSMTLRWNQDHPPTKAVRKLEIIYLSQTLQPDLTLTAPAPRNIYQTKF